MPFVDMVKENRDRRTHECTLKLDDGCFITLMKLGSKPHLYYHNRLLCPVVLKPLWKAAERILLKLHSDVTISVNRRDRATWRMAIDMYLFAWAVALLALYCVAFYCASTDTVAFGMGAAAVLALCRVYEIISYEAGFQSRTFDTHDAQSLEIGRTLWHYIEVIIAFGIYYLAVAQFWRDTFRSPSSDSASCIQSQWLNSIYFSFMTITTVGYGDFSPKTVPGKVLAMAEVMVGIFLLVITLQRVMAAVPMRSGAEAVPVGRMPMLIPNPGRIEAAGDKLIEEYIGRVNSQHGQVSIAHMHSPGGWGEPGQTPEFDEFTVVLKGMLQVRHRGGIRDVRAGQAVVAHKGEWVQYGTPEPEGAEYIAVCVPAFSPETVHRDQS
jgi:mannose-6-phosphate isomerase-like protein (cupin superfamily)